MSPDIKEAKLKYMGLVNSNAAIRPTTSKTPTEWSSKNCPEEGMESVLVQLQARMKSDSARSP
jgi:hypothetical protein